MTFITNNIIKNINLNRLFQIILLVYDVTNSSSFEILDEWIAVINEINDKQEENKPLMVIIGNKCDMDHQRTVKRDKSHRYAAEKGFIYYDMSARTGEAVIIFCYFYYHFLLLASFILLLMINICSSGSFNDSKSCC